MAFINYRASFEQRLDVRFWLVKIAVLAGCTPDWLRPIWVITVTRHDMNVKLRHHISDRGSIDLNGVGMGF